MDVGGIPRCRCLSGKGSEQIFGFSKALLELRHGGFRLRPVGFPSSRHWHKKRYPHAPEFGQLHLLALEL